MNHYEKLNQLDTIIDHPSQRLSEKATARMDGLFEQIQREDCKRACKRCIHLLSSHLGEGGCKAFLSTTQPELDYKTGAELLQQNPNELLRLIEDKLEGGNY